MSLRDAFWPLLGHWTGEEALGPGRAAARAMLVLKLDLGGRAVLLDYRRVGADGSELTGHGVILADPGTDELLWWSFDSNGTPPAAPLRGHRSGAGLTFSAGPGGEHHLRLDGDRLTRTAPGLSGSYVRLTVGH